MLSCHNAHASDSEKKDTNRIQWPLGTPIFHFKFSLTVFPVLENFVFFSVFTFAKFYFPLLLYLSIFITIMRK